MIASSKQLGWLIERAVASRTHTEFIEDLLSHLKLVTRASVAAAQINESGLRHLCDEPLSAVQLAKLSAVLKGEADAQATEYLLPIRLPGLKGRVYLSPVTSERLAESADALRHAIALLELVCELDIARDEAAHDPLTKLLNRRSMLAQIRKAIAQAQRYEGRTLCVVMLDLDNFKWFNDTFGHVAGDEFLCEFAAALQREIRASDQVCRWGGDEFLLLLPQTTAVDAEVLMQRISDRLSKFLGAYSGHGPRLGFSRGTSEFPADGDHAEVLIACADERLYADKRRV